VGTTRQMQKYSEKALILALDFLINFGRCILAMGEHARAPTAPFPNTFAFEEYRCLRLQNLLCASTRRAVSTGDRRALRGIGADNM